MVNSLTTFQQRVEITKPDKSAPVVGLGGKSETLVLDGAVDAFVLSSSNAFPMRGLDDLEALLKSDDFVAFKARWTRDGFRELNNTMYRESPHSQGIDSSKVSLSAVPLKGSLRTPYRPQEKIVEVQWGAQKARFSGNAVQLETSSGGGVGSQPMKHVIVGEHDADGNLVCTGEIYATASLGAYGLPVTEWNNITNSFPL